METCIVFDLQQHRLSIKVVLRWLGRWLPKTVTYTGLIGSDLTGSPLSTLGNTGSNLNLNAAGAALSWRYLNNPAFTVAMTTTMTTTKLA